MRFLSGNPVKAAVVITIAAASLSLTAGGGNSDPSKAADKATSVATSATPTPAPDPIFTKGKVNRDDFSHDLTEGLKKMRTYHMEGSMGVAMSGEKHTMKLSSDYDGHDQSAPKAHVLVSAPDEGKDADVVILGKDVYQRSGSKWVKSSKTGVGMGQADVAKTVRESTNAMESVTYVGEDSRGHRFDVVLDPAKMGGREAAATMNQKVKTTYWLDDAKRVVGMKMSTGAEGAGVTMDMTLSKFAEPVRIPKVS